MAKLRNKSHKSAPPRKRDFHVSQVYHIYQRGSRQQTVFRTRAQLIDYLDHFDRLARRYRVRVHAFCLMSNHVHFVLEPLQKWGVWQLMQHLQSHYARKIHQALGTRGHLWRNHFCCKHITSASHYRSTILYVEQNPTAAGMCGKAHLYDYSSAPAHTANSPYHRLNHSHHRCEVRLYLTRWRKKFPAYGDWANWLRSPRDAAHQAELAEIERVLRSDRIQPPKLLPLPQPATRQAGDRMAAAHGDCQTLTDSP